MFRAAWNGAMPAESDRTMKVEGRHYLPGHGEPVGPPGHRGGARRAARHPPGEGNPGASWLSRAAGPHARRAWRRYAVDQTRRPAAR